MSASQPPEIPAGPPLMPPVQPGGPAAQLAPRKPNWPKVVGILGIIFGAFGVIGGAQLMAMPSMMDMQKGMMSSMEKAFERRRPNRRDFEAPPDEENRSSRRDFEAPPKEVFKVFNKMFDIPDWFGTWCKVGGILAMLISGFYIFAAIRLLQIKSGAVGLFYCAAGLAIALALVKVGVAVSLGSLMSIGMIMGGIIGGVADVILFVVVATGSKEMFARHAA